MTNKGIVNIHGKDYMTVARRLELAHEDKSKKLESVTTEILSHDPVVVKATVVISGQPFTGISSVSLESSKYIERENPYEVAETSAVGRALGFAGFGLIESVASADEVVRAVRTQPVRADGLVGEKSGTQTSQRMCAICGQPAAEKKGTAKNGKAYHAIFCSSEDKTHTQWLS